MTRRPILRPIFVVLIALAMAGGCANQKKKNKADEKSDLAQAQRDVRQTPDKFESSDDPPLNADTHFAAGQFLESQGDVAQAIVQYQQALKINPNHRNALYRLGLAYTSKEQYRDAIAVWQRYVSVTNNSPAAYNNLALCYEQAGQLAEAEQTFKAGISRDPNERACRINYGLMLARNGRVPEAIAQLETVLTPAEVQYNLGSVLEEKGKLDQAKAYYRKALELDPNLKDAKTRLSAMK